MTVIIDNSCSCFSPLSIQHSWSTIQILLHNLGLIDLPCFYLIVDILSEKSQIWPVLFDLLHNNIQNTDLASAIRVVYNLHNAWKFLLPDFLFVITDGLFSKSEIKRIVENVNFCFVKGINIFGIGVGVSPFGIEQLFPSIIYSLNPNKLIQGIASCFSGNSINNSNMKTQVSKFQIEFNNTDITNSQENPIYKDLKNKLMNIPIELSSYDYYQLEIPQDVN